MPTLRLPQPDGSLADYTPRAPTAFHRPTAPFRERIAFAAAHVVIDPLRTDDPMTEVCFDWDATLAYRRHLWSWGFAVAEAMDTAQRGMGLSWEGAQALIRRSVAEAHTEGGRIACGAGTDHLAPGPGVTLADVEAAYEEQVGFVEGVGGQVILMASRALAACATGPDDYVRVYDRILSQARRPVILHWLGDMFDPALAGYWGTRDLGAAMDVCLGIIGDHAARVDGIKISLLDDAREVEMRRRLPPGVRMYTGDDFNYPALIRGDGHGHSHALLGIFDAIAPAASAALQALDAGDAATYNAVFTQTVPLARHIFQAPTRYYKTGVVFLAYLNDYQTHFRMLGGQESARSIGHLSQLFVLADRAGLLRDPDLAAARMRHALALAGL